MLLDLPVLLLESRLSIKSVTESLIRLIISSRSMFARVVRILSSVASGDCTYANKT